MPCSNQLFLCKLNMMFLTCFSLFLSYYLDKQMIIEKIMKKKNTGWALLSFFYRFKYIWCVKTLDRLEEGEPHPHPRLINVVLLPKPCWGFHFCWIGFFLIPAPYLLSFDEQGSYESTVFPAVRNPCSSQLQKNEQHKPLLWKEGTLSDWISSQTRPGAVSIFTGFVFSLIETVLQGYCFIYISILTIAWRLYKIPAFLKFKQSLDVGLIEIHFVSYWL